MKVLLLCNKVPYPPDDGSSIAVYAMAEGLRSAGAEVFVWAINTRKHYKPDEDIPVEIRKNWSYWSVYYDTTPTFSGALANLFFTRRPYFSSRFLINEFSEKLVEFLKKNPVDVVQLEGLFMGNYIPFIRAHSNAIISYRAHNVEFLIWDRMAKNMRNFFKKKYLLIQTQRLKKFEEWVLRQSDLVVPITDEDEKFLRSWVMTTGKQVPMLAVPTGIWSDDFAPSVLQTNPFSVFFFGSMDWMPNEEAACWLAFEIFPALRKHIPDIQCLIVGRHMPRRLKNLSTLGITVMEHVKDKTEIYNRGTIMLVPLLSGSGLKIKMIEGMARGKCIITTPIGAEGIHATHAEHFFIAHNTRDFVQTIVELHGNPEKIKYTGDSARRFVFEKFNNRIFGKTLFDFYLKTLGQTR